MKVGSPVLVRGGGCSDPVLVAEIDDVQFNWSGLLCQSGELGYSTCMAEGNRLDHM